MKKIKIFGFELKYKSSLRELLPEMDTTIVYTDKFIEALRNLGVCILIATILASFFPHSLGSAIFAPLLIVTCFIWSLNVCLKFVRWYIKRKDIDIDKERSLISTFIIVLLIAVILGILLFFALIPSLQTIIRMISMRN